MHLECPLLLKPTFDMRQANDGFVPSFAILTALRGTRKPMNECPELASAERALSVHKWVWLEAVEHGHVPQTARLSQPKAALLGGSFTTSN